MDEYDSSVSEFDKVMHIYSHDNAETVILDFMEKVTPPNPETSIVINYQTFKQTEEDEKLKKNITWTIKYLSNALSVLDSRTITTIGGKVAHYIVPEKFDPDLGFRPKWYLVQVWR